LGVYLSADTPTDLAFDIRSLMGSDIEIGDEYEFPPDTAEVSLIGQDGDIYLYLPADGSGDYLFYGPRTNGVWGEGQ